MIDSGALIRLRKETQAPLLECKKSLEEAGGDLEKAKEILKKKGMLASLKKKERETKNGIVEAYIHSNKRIGVLLALYCETDFVARNETFKEFAHQLSMQIASMNPKDEKELLEENWIFDEKLKVSDKLNEVILKTGENIKIGQFVRFEIE